MLKGESLSFCYKKGGRMVISGLTAELHSGEIIGLAAPSGFGKTTLCKLLAGYEQPFSGSVTLDGKPLSGYPGYCPVQMIWQHPELVLNPRLRLSQSLSEAGALDPRITEGLGIEKDWLSRYPGELSGGELQRFCIARALGGGTRFLLCDEISAMLDLITQAQIWAFLTEETKKRSLGLLVVSHQEELLKRLCTRQLDIQAK